MKKISAIAIALLSIAQLNCYSQIQHIVHYPFGTGSSSSIVPIADHQNRIWITGKRESGYTVADYDGMNWNFHDLPYLFNWGFFNMDFDASNHLVLFWQSEDSVNQTSTLVDSVWNNTLLPSLVFPGNYWPVRFKIDAQGNYWFALFKGTPALAVAKWNGTSLTIWDSTATGITGPMRDFDMGPDGKIYAITSNGISVFDGSQWHPVANNPNNPIGFCSSGDVNYNNQYFVVGDFLNSIGIYTIENDSLVLYQDSEQPDLDLYNMSASDDGTILISGMSHAYALNGATTETLPVSFGMSASAYDHSGSFWRAGLWDHSAVDQYVLLTGIPQADHGDEALYVYPNPGIDQLLLSIPNMIHKNRTVTISDITGRIVYDKEIEGSQETIDVSQWSSGIYFVQLRTGDHADPAIKFVKQ